MRNFSTYSSPDFIKVIRSRKVKWVGHVAHLGEIKCISGFVTKPEGKRLLGRPRYR